MGFHAQKLPSCFHTLCLRRKQKQKQKQEEKERGQVLRTTVLSCGCGFINLAEKKDQVLLISAAFIRRSVRVWSKHLLHCGWEKKK